MVALTEKKRRALEDLARNPERAAVHDALRKLHREKHPHLPQYVASVVSPSGLTLREAAAVLGVSHQRIAQLRDRGRRQVQWGERFDLSYWPVLPPIPPRPARGSKVEADMLVRIRRMNAEAKKYRRGHDPKKALAFYRMVAKLHDEGIPYTAIAESLHEEERAFVRRLARWGVTEGRHGKRLTVPAREQADAEEGDD